MKLPAGMPALRVTPMPADANFHGDIFGGWIMSQVDIAGGVVAMTAARGRVATVAVNSFVFKEPVLIGDRVSFYGEVVRIGNTSITTKVVNMNMSPRIIPGTMSKTNPMATASASRIDAPRYFQNGRGCQSKARSAVSGLSCAAR